MCIKQLKKWFLLAFSFRCNRSLKGQCCRFESYLFSSVYFRQVFLGIAAISHITTVLHYVIISLKSFLKIYRIGSYLGRKVRTFASINDLISRVRSANLMKIQIGIDLILVHYTLNHESWGVYLSKGYHGLSWWFFLYLLRHF
jgi:hypothetical protein